MQEFSIREELFSPVSFNVPFSQGMPSNCTFLLHWYQPLKGHMSDSTSRNIRNVCNVRNIRNVHNVCMSVTSVMFIMSVMSA